MARNDWILRVALDDTKKLPRFYPWELFANQCLAEASKPAEAGDLIAHT